MIMARQQTPHTLFSTEHECVTHLFKKRWPQGFVCPFCNRLQTQTAPAYNVVCRYCRKMTSITAHTVMHGSKNSLISWMMVAWQFCSREQGISAREIQRLMDLSSYQTAWTWLKKLRRGAALAESMPCSGIVVFDILPLALPSSQDGEDVMVGIAMETQHPGCQAERIRLGLLDSMSMKEVSTLIARLVVQESTLFIRNSKFLHRYPPEYLCRQSMRAQRKEAEIVIGEAVNWLTSTYRKGIDSVYLQSYLDEFSFRYNTSAWSDNLMVFEHLLTGLLSNEHSPTVAVDKRDSNLMQQTLSGGGK